MRQHAQVEKGNREKIRLEKTEPLAQPVRDDVYLDIFEETLQYKTKGTLWRLKSQVIEIERTGELKLNNGEVYEIGKPKRKREWYMQKTIDGNFIIFSIDMPAQNDITSLLTEVPITAVDPKEGTKLMRYVLYLETVIIFLLTALYILPPELAIYFFGFIRPETIIGYTIAIMIFFWNVYQLQKYRTALTGGFRIIDKRLEAIDLVLYDEKANEIEIQTEKLREKEAILKTQMAEVEAKEKRLESQSELIYRNEKDKVEEEIKTYKTKIEKTELHKSIVM